MDNVIDCLKERGFVDAMTSEELQEITSKPIKLYVGFDPTADSLHLGNLMGIMALAWFQRFGHTPVAILGGATGRIGDPSGKSIERPFLDNETIVANIASIRKHFEKTLDFASSTNPPMILNNDDWYNSVSLVEFLRDVGKYFRVNVMLSKEMVRARLASEDGISFTEFSYQLLQGYDFYHLYEKFGVILQVGGSDQWGNITAGIELIRKKIGGSAYGLTWPLLTRSDGKKFGKTEEGAIWLSPERCSPYQFYQYLVRLPDPDVIPLMRLLTFMSMEEIGSYERQMAGSDYIPNTAQRRLAEEITRFVHGQEGLELALKVTEGASPGAKTLLDPELLKEIGKDMPHASLPKQEVIGQKYVDVAVKLSLLSSKAEAVRLIQNGGAYLNNEKITDPNFRFTQDLLIGDQYLLMGIGKKKKVLLTLTD